MIPYRCNKRIKTIKCGKRKSFKKEKAEPYMKCPKCGNLSMTPDKYRIAGRKIPNKDNPPECNCHGKKSRKENKVVYQDGVKKILGPHRFGQYGCIYHPEYGVPETAPDDYWSHLDEAAENIDCQF